MSTRNLLGVLALGMLVGAVACSSTGGPEASAVREEAGSLGLTLQTSTAATLNSFN